MDELKIVYDIIVAKDKNILLSDIHFSNREINFEEFIDTYKVKRNIAISNQDICLNEKYTKFINSLEIHIGTSLNKIKLAYIIREKYFKLYIFDNDLLKLISVLELMG